MHDNFYRHNIEDTSTQLKPINLFEYEKLGTNALSQKVLDYYSSGAWDEVI
ncbi:hypothetical protein [Plectonema radiosum]|nr:hypothetical protein [Plectonema radiosum]